MAIKVTPKFKRNLIRVIPFGIIWLASGSMFLLAETVATGNQNLNPESMITLSWPVFLFASFAITVVGMLVGAIEMVVLEKRFRHQTLTKKIIYKFGIYIFLMILIIAITYPIAAIIELDTNLSDPRIWKKMKQFFLSIIFLNTLAQLGFSLLLSLIYAAISENLGPQVLLNFFTGKYHRPKIETRIFMFLDMKSSTTIAEKLGHVRYFEMLRDYYDAMSDAIISHRGEVYQYVGDEVVVSWKHHLGVENNNCIKCFFAIKKGMHQRHDRFMEKFGIVPDFKAGMHVGDVTTGEIGALKKEIVFTGDVLNSTARIQALCTENKADLIISEALVSLLPGKEMMTFRDLGTSVLRGKSAALQLVAVDSAEC